MTEAKQDSNGVVTMLGVSSDDGITPTPAYGDASTHMLDLDSTGSVTGGGSIGKRDANGRVSLMALSSADGTTPVMVHIDPANGKIKVQT